MLHLPVLPTYFFFQFCVKIVKIDKNYEKCLNFATTEPLGYTLHSTGNSPEPEPVHFNRLQQKSPAPAPQHHHNSNNTST